MGFNYHGITTDMTKQLCHFVKELKYEDIPPMVIERAKTVSYTHLTLPTTTSV